MLFTCVQNEQDNHEIGIEKQNKQKKKSDLSEIYPMCQVWFVWWMLQQQVMHNNNLRTK